MPIRRTPIDDLWEPVEETFDGAFQTVCRSTPHASHVPLSPDKEAKHYLSSEGKADGMEWNGRTWMTLNSSTLLSTAPYYKYPVYINLADIYEETSRDRVEE
jgi:hypothetical protein